MKTIYQYSFLLLAVLTLVSCRQDLLEQDPTDQLSSSQYWKNESDAQSALAGLVSDTRYLFNRDYYLDGMGEYVKMRGNSFLDNNGNNGRAYMGRWDYLPWGFGGWFDNMFKYCYGAVNRANYVIENVTQMRDQASGSSRDALNTIIAECKLMRALVYFRLITWWGDVPYVDWNVKSNDEVASLPRTPIADIYSHLISDLDEVVAALPVKAAVRGRYSKPAAIALRGKIHLYWASWNHFGWPELDTFTPSEAEAQAAYKAAREDFRAVIEDYGLDLFRGGEPGVCDEPAEVWPAGSKVQGVDMTGKVKKLGGATNLPNYYYLFLPSANGDPEFVFTFEHGGTSTAQGEQLMRDMAGRTVQYSQSWVNPRANIADRYQSTVTGDFCPPMKRMSPSATARVTENSSLNPQSYANRDYRMKSSIMWDYEQCMGMMSLKETGFTQYEYKNWEGPLSVFEENPDGSVTEKKYTTYNILSTTGYVFRKFVRNYAGQDRTDGDFNWPVIRLADVFLMYAEADNEINNGPTAKSISLVNRIRHRGNLPPLTNAMTANHDAFFDAIEQERIVELLAEGHRVWDLRRWRRLEKVYGGPGSNGYKWYDVFGAQENEYWVNSPSLQYEQCYIFRIPESERNKNPNLTQNKPWR